MAPETEMTLDTAAELAENYRTKVAVPFEKLAEVLRVAKDSKNRLAVYAKQIPELEGRLAALKIEEAAATARVANAKVRATDAEHTTDGVAQEAALRASTVRQDAAKRIAEVEREIAIRRERLEADYTARQTTLEGLLTAAQQKLDALRQDYENLLAAGRSKFGA